MVNHMGRKKTTEEVIQDFKQVHGDSYDYSQVEYTGALNKVKIICNVHGVFEQSPNHHKKGKGCRRCADDNKTLSTESCIEQFKQVHGDSYDYSQVEYVNSATKVKIICNVHGLFEQIPASHKSGNGCRKCADDNNTFNRTLTTEKCIELFKNVHGSEKYDYSQVEYTGAHNKVNIICNVHGVFKQQPNSHKSGNGCRKCKNDNRTLTTEKCIEQFKQVHGDIYDYSKVEYINSKTKVKIICPEHGVFEQMPVSHKSGSGCPSCAKSGYDNLKEGSFYIQKLFKDNTFMGVKIGITNRDPVKRMKQQSRCSIYRHELFTNIREKDGKVVQELELRLKQQFGKFRSTIDKQSMNDGYTETYSKESLMYIIPFIESQYKLIIEEKPQ